MNVLTRPGIGLAVAAAMIVLTAACGGDGAAPAASTPTAAASAGATEAARGGAASASAPAAAPSPASTAAAAAPAADPLVARGKEIFEKTAGGVGCAACHGMDGKGNGPAGVGAPANRGADEARVRAALGSVALMANVKLTDDEIKAVVAYLAVLARQP